jgi:hypothetical protein
MNSFGDMCENRILTLTPFLPQGVKWVNFYGDSYPAKTQALARRFSDATKTTYRDMTLAQRH